MENKSNDNRYIEPDHELLNWEKWVRIRKEEIENLNKKTGRLPVDMVMNLHEKVREDIEWKTVLENAQLKTKPTLRGSLWEQPLRLKQKCYCEPVYEVQRKCEEMGIPPIMEHVGVPQDILENEKGVYGISERKKCIKLDNQFHKYKEKREVELKKKIKKIDPYRSEISGLLVKGNKSKTSTKVLPALPKILLYPTDDLPSEDSSRICAVRINNTVLIKAEPGQHLAELRKMQHEKWHESCSSWFYYFNVPVKRVGRARLFIQNLGTVTLRYCWKKIKQQIPFIPEDTVSQVFFFNKNEDVLSPGQSREVNFTFVSNDTGIYSELWELIFCNVTCFDSLLSQLTVNLQADCVDDMKKIRHKTDLLKVRLNRKAVRKLIRKMLNEAIEKASSVEPQIYPYKKLFLEAEMFVMKNPVCFYHQTEINKLKEFYAEMTTGETWDLSITSWRSSMMQKAFDDRMKYYEILQQSHSELLKPWYEGKSVLEQKYHAVKLILMELADKFDKEYLVLTKASNLTEQSDEMNGMPLETILLVMIHSDSHWMERKIFYMRMYDHIATAVEACVGVISSLDLNRWIHFDFCRQ
ncbi:unnamed protein product [Parnassius apollo]|uniref:(apollo) hypothetical protein n=1 Tax=Parnassius apollo TaxID=110799 RepID=A0A8S3Y0Q4_PARAO|nr:unnamed protein product [Parnassius apollo]